MKLIWSKNKRPLSLLIRAITGQDCSHFAFVFTNLSKGVMFESNLLGSHIKFYESSKSRFEVVHEINLETTIEVEDMIWDRVVAKFDGKRYDFGGALYLGVRTLLKRMFGVPLPKQNIWSDPDAYFCNEVYDALEGVAGLPVLQASSGLETPHDVWDKLKGALNVQ